MKRLIKQSQFAERVGLSRARVTQLVQEKVLILIQGKVDLAQGIKALQLRRDRRRRQSIQVPPEVEKILW